MQCLYVSGTLSICQMMGSSCQQACTFNLQVLFLVFYFISPLVSCCLFVCFFREGSENSDGGGKEIRVQHKATFFKLATEIKNSAIFLWKKKNKKRETCDPPVRLPKVILPLIKASYGEC